MILIQLKAKWLRNKSPDNPWEAMTSLCFQHISWEFVYSSIYSQQTLGTSVCHQVSKQTLGRLFFKICG